MDRLSEENCFKISPIEPDWKRERVNQWWSPSEQLLKSIRKYQKWRENQELSLNFCRKFM